MPNLKMKRKESEIGEEEKRRVRKNLKERREEQNAERVLSFDFEKEDEDSQDMI